jgi:YegS/Rv2252/BmrU family lipid kinase
VSACAIVNPRAGSGSRRALAALENPPARLRPLELRLTSRAGEARELAIAAAQAGCDPVLAVGGDGTANEVAWGLLGSQATLGLVPVGSGNGLARTLGIPLDPRRALVVLEHARARRMDVGFANDRPFLNVAGAGFDAAVGLAFHERARAGARRGVLGYVRAGLGIVLAYRPPALTIEGVSVAARRALLLTLSNGPQYGGGAVIAPGARLDDGLLDVVCIEDAPRLPLLLQAPRLFLGGIERLPAYSRAPAATLVLTAAEPFAHHRDGEPEPAVTRLEVRVAPKALSVLVARSVAEDPRGPFAPE